MSKQNILAVALGLASTVGAFAAEPVVQMQVETKLVNMQVETKLVQLKREEKLVNLSYEGKLVSSLPTSAPAPTTPPPATREARFKALYGDSAADDDAAIKGFLAKAASPTSQSSARASETAPGIRGLLNKPANPTP